MSELDEIKKQMAALMAKLDKAEAEKNKSSASTGAPLSASAPSVKKITQGGPPKSVSVKEILEGVKTGAEIASKAANMTHKVVDAVDEFADNLDIGQLVIVKNRNFKFKELVTLNKHFCVLRYKPEYHKHKKIDELTFECLVIENDKDGWGYYNKNHPIIKKKYNSLFLAINGQHMGAPKIAELKKKFDKVMKHMPHSAKDKADYIYNLFDHQALLENGLCDKVFKCISNQQDQPKN